MDERLYNVSVEFEKYSKKYSNVPEPKFEIHGTQPVLVVEDPPRNRKFKFSWNQVQYMSMEEVK